MAGIAKRGISNATAMVACAVRLVAAATVVMVLSVALAHWQADPPVSFHAMVSRASDEVAWDAARGSAVALANLYNLRHPMSIGRTLEMSSASRSDECSLSGIHVPAHAAPDAFAGITVPAVQDCLADVQTCSGQSAVAGPEHGMATHPEHARTKDAFARPMCVGSADPAHRVAVSQMSVRYADRHAVAAPGELADCREAVAATRRGWTMDAPEQTLPVERAILSQAQPTSLLAQADSRALDAGRLHDPATGVMASACVGEATSAAGANPELGNADTRFGRFHSRGLCTYRVTV